MKISSKFVYRETQLNQGFISLHITEPVQSTLQFNMYVLLRKHIRSLNCGKSQCTKTFLSGSLPFSHPRVYGCGIFKFSQNCALFRKAVRCNPFRNKGDCINTMGNCVNYVFLHCKMSKLCKLVPCEQEIDRSTVRKKHNLKVLSSH